jgi:HK97 family phage portal protein
MGLIGTALRGVRIGADSGYSDFWYEPRGAPNNSGMPITADSALRISIAYACVRLISESLGMLPLIVYRRQADGGKTRAPDHPLYDVLHDRPNVSQTSIEFLSMMQAHLLLRGNAYAEILPGPRGPVDQLMPLHPDRVRVDEQPDGSLRYRLRQKDGTERVLLADQVFHLRGMSLDGKTGLSVISYAAQSMGMTAAVESYGASFFGRGSRPSGLLKTTGKLSADAAERMQKRWQSTYGGVGNAHKVAVMEEGLEFQALGMTNEDSQFLATREFQAGDTVRWFGVPLHMVQFESRDSSWGTGIESMGQEFVTYTLGPWMMRWQQKIASDLIVAPQAYSAEFLPDALLRGNTTERYTAYQMAAGGNAPWLSRNDVRRRENMNPLPGLDDILQPLNMGGSGEQKGQAAPPQNGRVPSAPPSQNGSANGHAALEDGFARDAAERVARREVAALTRAARRTGVDEAAWQAEVAQFYGEHAAFVAETMRLSRQDARGYTAGQGDYLRDMGPTALEQGFVESSADRLIALAAGGVE